MFLGLEIIPQFGIIENLKMMENKQKVSSKKLHKAFKSNLPS